MGDVADTSEGSAGRGDLHIEGEDKLVVEEVQPEVDASVSSEKGTYRILH